jgi:hypothetical protein
MVEIVKLLGHDNCRAIDIFKTNCEGCEWETLKNNPSIPTMQQILVETHHNPLTAVPFFNGLTNNGYVMFHKEPNIQFGGGRCVECVLLKLDKLTTTFLQAVSSSAFKMNKHNEDVKLMNKNRIK